MEAVKLEKEVQSESTGDSLKDRAFNECQGVEEPSGHTVDKSNDFRYFSDSIFDRLPLVIDQRLLW